MRKTSQYYDVLTMPGIPCLLTMPWMAGTKQPKTGRRASDSHPD